MGKKKKSLDEGMADILETFTLEGMVDLFRGCQELFGLFDYEDGKDWLEGEVGAENVDAVRLARSVYLLSKFADRHSARLCYVSTKYPRFWQRMEKAARQENVAQNVDIQ